MFKKILIANRGEIACRVIASAKQMGIKTVAVHSDADRDALHVRLADESYSLGGMSASESYLRGCAIIAAMKAHDAEAVHPGYGFLSENADFATAVAKAGFSFIGPPPKAIAVMGDKIESKMLARKAGVSIIAGSDGAIANVDEARAFAQKIGYPIMVKASAGGGGKGMRVVEKEGELADALRLAMSEAKASFGDERVFIEKLITSPRHIEIQVLADSHGHVIYLGERDCSVQRRHQKVIEEAPSPFVDEDMRRRMGEQAVALAKKVGYVSAGTVEFVAGGDGSFYFLEMNTRLQVEHPVTELVTGLDLVEWMIKIAAGEKLTIEQNDVTIDGWAMEARIYAEDPARGFLPSTGRLVRHAPPPATQESDHIIRLDTGVEEGSDISIYYDPMIAKLCAWSPHRATTIEALRHALDQYDIKGVAHNGYFLSDLLLNEEFCKTGVTTQFIQNYYPEGYQASLRVPLSETIFPLVAAYMRQIMDQLERTIEDQLESEGHAQTSFREKVWVVVMGQEQIPVTLAFEETLGHDCVMEMAGRKHEFHGSWRPHERLLACRVDGVWHHIQLEMGHGFYQLTHAGQMASVLVLESRVADYYRLMPAKKVVDLSRFLLAPMPGLLVSLAVKEGDAVRQGQELAVIEAMKMENILRADKDAVVQSIDAAQGDSLAVDQVIMTFADSSS